MAYSLVRIIGFSLIASVATNALAGGGFFDDKYLYSDKDLIRLEQVYQAGKRDGETVVVQNVMVERTPVKDLSKSSKSASADEEAKLMANKVPTTPESVTVKSIDVAVAKQIDRYTAGRGWNEKVRKEVIIPGELDEMLLELDLFLNQPLIIEQSQPANMLKIVATTIPAGWRIFFSNTVKDDFLDEYEFFVPSVPRAVAFKKLEDAFGVEISVMNQPERPYVVVSKKEVDR
jgi:hypothetical protein